MITLRTLRNGQWSYNVCDMYHKSLHYSEEGFFYNPAKDWEVRTIYTDYMNQYETQSVYDLNNHHRKWQYGRIDHDANDVEHVSVKGTVQMQYKSVYSTVHYMDALLASSYRQDVVSQSWAEGVKYLRSFEDSMNRKVWHVIAHYRFEAGGNYNASSIIFWRDGIREATVDMQYIDIANHDTRFQVPWFPAEFDSWEAFAHGSADRISADAFDHFVQYCQSWLERGIPRSRMDQAGLPATIEATILLEPEYPVDLLVEQIKAYANNRVLENLLLQYQTERGTNIRERKVAWSDLSAKALSTLEADFSGNGLMLISDALNMSKDLKAMANTLRHMPNGKVKAAAATYLGIHYGIKLMFRDCIDLYEALKSEQKRGVPNKIGAVEHGTFNGFSYTRRYTVLYDQHCYPRTSLSDLLEDLDFDLTLDNVWDSIPLSFIADWFLTFGKALSALDSYYKVKQDYPVLMCFETEKAQKEIELPAGVSGSMYYEIYIRNCREEIRQPSMYVTSTTNPLQQHAVEAGALVVSFLH